MSDTYRITYLDQRERTHTTDVTAADVEAAIVTLEKDPDAPLYLVKKIEILEGEPDA